MTAQIIPFASQLSSQFSAMRNLNPVMLQKMLKEMSVLQDQQNVAQVKQAQIQSWQNLLQDLLKQQSEAAQPQNTQPPSADPSMGFLLGMMLFGGLFPAAAVANPVMQIVQALSQMQFMNMIEDAGNVPELTLMDRLLGVNTQLSAITQNNNSQGNDIISLLMSLFDLKPASGTQGGKSGGGKDPMVAHDVLRRNPREMDFKRNYEEFVNRNEVMRRQKQDMFVKAAPCARKLACQ